ncbi:MAG: rhomboid family intramembrane serine protease, partial [Pseudomonadota bacterium]
MRNGEPGADAAAQGRRGVNGAGPEGEEPERQTLTLRGAPVTVGLIGFCIALRLAAEIGLFAQGPAEMAYGVRFLSDAPLATAGLGAGEAHRLLTHMFLHADFLHAAINMGLLAIVGPPVERACGGLGFAVLFLLCGAAGGLAHIAYESAAASLSAPGPLVRQVILVGASGAVCGVLGVELRRRSFWLHRFVARLRAEGGPLLRVGPFLSRAAIGFVLLNLVVAVVEPGIAGMAHIGGFALGLAVTPWFLLKTGLDETPFGWGGAPPGLERDGEDGEDGDG